MRVAVAATLCALLLAVTACTAPAQVATPAAPETGIALPDPATPDRSCKSDSDCAVKNVGNCCGYYPACVNKDSQTNPEAVQAECAKEGRMGVCGFPSISSCKCVKGHCEGSNQLSPAS